MKTQLLILVLFLQVAIFSIGQNVAPVVADNGYQDYSVCTPLTYDHYYVNGMQVYDANADTLTIVSITSTNNNLINPANLYTYVALPDASYQSYVMVSGPAGVVGSPTNVTLNVTFSDGHGGTLTVPLTFTLKPSPTVVFLETSYDVCSSQGVVDVNQWVYPVGGTFAINNEQEFYDGIFHTDWAQYDFSLDYTYTGSNGCSSTAEVPVYYHEAPQITLYATNSSSCVIGDGSVDAAIYSPSGANYTFVWNDGNTVETDRTGLLPGVYHIDVKDQYGCVSEASTSVMLNGVSFNEVIDTVACFGGNTGAITTNITGLISPVNVYWSSGQTTPSITGLTAGMYTMNLQDATGCAFAASFYVPENSQIYAYEYVYAPTDCSTNDALIYYSGVYGGHGSNYNVQWSNGPTGFTNGNLSTGIYSATISDDLGCSVQRTYTVGDYNAPYAYLMNIESAHCNAFDGSIDMDTTDLNLGVVTATWSNGVNTLDMVNAAAGEYILHLQNAQGCDGYQWHTIPSVAPQLQPICMVSVDSATTTNLVVWEKVDPNNVAYYNIYRETVNPNEFMWIDSVSNNDESIFNDVMASPTVQSWRYKVSAVDACGNEGPLSMAHKTMHITTTDLGNGDFKATWNPYYGIDYDFYILYRYTALTGWEEIATLPAVVTSYYDTPPNSIDLDYMTELAIDFTCVADLQKAQDFNTTRSNKDKGNFIMGQGTGDSNNSLSEESVSVMVYPNPVTDELNIELSLNGVNKTIYLISVEGQIIQEFEASSIHETVDMSSLKNGMYFIRIAGQNETVPVVKQ